MTFKVSYNTLFLGGAVPYSLLFYVELKAVHVQAISSPSSLEHDMRYPLAVSG